MFWTKKPPFCDTSCHTADTELGEYSILDTTITECGSISAFFQPPQGQARKPRKHQCIGTPFETIAKGEGGLRSALS